jgi:hypothetical protein
MKTIKHVLGVALLVAGSPASWAIVGGPYVTDSNTLHLWHLNEAANNPEDSGFVDANDIDLKLTINSPGNGEGYLKPAYSPAFGTAVSVGTTAVRTHNAFEAISQPVNQSSLQGADGAFTYEAIMHFTSLTDAHVIMALRDVSSTVWQLSINHNDGLLSFVKKVGGASTISAPIYTGPNTPNTTDWFHVAVAYDGVDSTASNLKIYWTKLQPSATSASLLTSGSITDIPGSASANFTLGNNYDAGIDNNSLKGEFDEARISDIARGQDQFLFIPEPSTAGLLCLAGLVWARRRAGWIRLTS